MPDYIAGIPVPTIADSGLTFPVRIDWPHTQVYPRNQVVHTFASGNAKIEQRFEVGRPARQWAVSRGYLTLSEREALRSFWISLQGRYGYFSFDAPQGDGTTESVKCRFVDSTITFEYLQGCLCSRTGLALVEEITEDTAPSYSVSATVTRFPTSGLATALLAPTHTFIPLLKITPTDTDVDPIYISDRRVTVGGQLYLPRLLKPASGIRQTTGSAADEAQFDLGNADRVMTKASNAVDLFMAHLEYSLFHVASTTKIDFWGGHVSGYLGNEGATFVLKGSDGAYELGLTYPVKRPSRLCNKPYDQAAGGCPFTASGALDLVNFPSADAAVCDHGFDTPNGCQAHGMDKWFGGIHAKPQTVTTRDNSSGTWGFGRSPLASASIINDTIYNEVLPEVWGDLSHLTDTSKGIPVNCKILAGRDEGDFYAAIGVVCAGPIAEYAEPTGGSIVPVYSEDDPSYPPIAAFSPFKLDGKAPHGWPANLTYGLRKSYGPDPAEPFQPDPASDKFSLGDGANGTQTYSDIKAAGVAFVEIRVKDESGLQPSATDEHKMTAMVRRGIRAWVWTAAGGAQTLVATSNPVWIAVSVYLRGRGLYLAPWPLQEAVIDVPACIAAAAICDTVVTKLVGGGTEKQYTFNGVIQEEKALRDWLTEILNCAGAVWTNSFGKLRITMRNDSSVAQAFTEGNMLFQTLELEPARPTFNRLRIDFGDEEFLFAGNNVSWQDDGHAQLLGSLAAPEFKPKSMSMAGLSTKSQGLRLAVTRGREELGGIRKEQWKALRLGKFSTTILALAVEPGQVISVTHDDCPDYYDEDGAVVHSNYVEGRVESVILNQDYSLGIVFRTTNDAAYDLTVGPKPVDVTADPVPDFDEQPPADWSYQVGAADGHIRFDKLACGTSGDGVRSFIPEVYYIDEAKSGYCRITANLSNVTTSLSYQGQPPVEGQYIVIDQEIMLVGAVTGPDSLGAGTAVLERGQLGTTAVAHDRVSTTVTTVTSAWHNEITVATGLGFQPGQRLINALSNEAFISEYDSATGLLRTALPVLGIVAGQDIYADPRIWNLEPPKNYLVSLPPRFFRSANRSQFTADFPLRMAGIVLVRARLENTRGISSGYLYRSFLGTFPRRIRTLDNTSYELTHSFIPSGTTLDLFERPRAPENQSFRGAYCELRGLVGPINSPRSIAAITPSALAASGSVTIAGTISEAATISISVSGGYEITFPLWVAADNGIDGTSTAADVAASLAAWLNADVPFAALFAASASGAVLSIMDQTGLGGTIACDTTDGITATPAGFTNALGITIGRRYALAYANTGAGYESDVGPLSDATGPTGDATEVRLDNIAVSPDSSVDKIRVYAPPQGADEPLYLVAEIDNSGPLGLASATDAIDEGSLAGQPTHATSQPALDGDLKLHVYADGQPWFDMRIAALDGPRSNVEHFLALGSIAEGAEISCDLDNDAGEGLYLRAVIL